MFMKNRERGGVKTAGKRLTLNRRRDSGQEGQEQMSADGGLVGSLPSMKKVPSDH